ncbi:hypothetical protein MTO96_014368 [Rhipicephalus appendiculatus]
MMKNLRQMRQPAKDDAAGSRRGLKQCQVDYLGRSFAVVDIADPPFTARVTIPRVFLAFDPHSARDSTKRSPTIARDEMIEVALRNEPPSPQQ